MLNYTRLERLAREKHSRLVKLVRDKQSSILGLFVSYEVNKVQ
jgi:hypothetical protein